jgi:type I restriction enzyme S subunit
MSDAGSMPISKVADCFTGYPFESKLFCLSGEGEARVFRGDNLKEGYSEWGDKERRWKDIAPELRRYELAEDDVLIGMDGSKVGKNWCKVLSSDLPALLGQRVCRIRASGKAHQEFLYHAFGSKTFSAYVERVKTGTSIPHISNEQIRNFEIFIPSLPEQKKIAEILSGIHDVICAKERKRLESQQGKRDKFEKNDDERNTSNLFLCFAHG